MKTDLSQKLKRLMQEHWHALPYETVLKKLHVTEKGLSFKEARKRKKIFGRNEIQVVKERSALVRFLHQFHDVLIYVLLLSAIISLFLQHFVDSTVIFGVVFLNAIIGYIQEYKAEKALQAIHQIFSLKAHVVRDGRRAVISAKSLVPGDIVLLGSGDKVPADVRLFDVKSLQIQEAILTGESNPVSKITGTVSETSTLGDRTSIAFGGTIVTYGRGRGIVIATGKNSEIGRISALIEKIPSLQTPLLRQMTRFGWWLMLIIFALSSVTFLVGAFVWGDKSSALFMAIVGVVVSAVPEGLPAIITITLAIGVTRMAKRHAIIRHLPAVETMGAVTTICTDKTGTITRNELAVQFVVTAEHSYHVTGGGYSSRGEFKLNDSAFPLEEHPDLHSLIWASVLCNDAELIADKEEPEMHGNPVDGALLALGLKAHLNLSFENQNFPRTDSIPFESQHKLMASLHHDHQGHGFIFVKGAPEKIFSRAQFQRHHEKNVPIDLAYWHEQLSEMAKKGLRVLAIAMKEITTASQLLQFSDIEQDLVLLGFIGLIDPPREEVISAVAQCQKAGIQIKMITGDHAVTAQAIGEQVGIGIGRGVLTGEQIDKMDDDYLSLISKDVDIYARTSPEHKLRLVKALQSQGHVVAMTGDGINDAPALKQAAIGVAMGQKGTEAAKEVAEMVLVDDNFASIVYAVEEGRTVYDNLKKAILYILPTNFGEALIIVFSILLGLSLPITAVQVLWINMITSVTFGLALSFESAETNVMQRPPRSPSAPILSRLLLWRVFFVAMLMVLSAFGMYLFEIHVGADLETARTAVVNMLVMAEGVYLFNCRYLYSSSLTLKAFFGSRAALIATGVVIILQIAFTYVPGFDHFFQTKPIDLFSWIRIVILGALIFMIVEIEKYFVNLYRRSKTQKGQQANV